MVSLSREADAAAVTFSVAADVAADVAAGVVDVAAPPPDCVPADVACGDSVELDPHAANRLPIPAPAIN